MFSIFKKKEPDIFSKLGFKNDQEGIMSRYTREALYWDKHLAHTKSFILKCAEKCQKKNAVILGSGWLLDVPVAELSKIFRNVFLVDVVQPRQIQYNTAKYKNVKLIQTDITGNGAELVWNAVKNYKQTGVKTNLCENLTKKNNFGIPPQTEPDFVVSVNLWNQLNILLIEYLERFEIYTPDELLAFAKCVQQTHLESLPKGKSCLISDYEENNYSAKDELVESKKLIFPDFPQSAFSENWEWIFDTHGYYHPKLKTVFKVRGISI